MLLDAPASENLFLSVPTVGPVSFDFLYQKVLAFDGPPSSWSSTTAQIQVCIESVLPLSSPRGLLEEPLTLGQMDGRVSCMASSLPLNPLSSLPSLPRKSVTLMRMITADSGLLWLSVTMRLSWRWQPLEPLAVLASQAKEPYMSS